MADEWVVEHLKTIRTLMERAAVYRRAMAPTTMLTGSLGLVAAVVGWVLGFATPQAFGWYWLGVGCVTVGGVGLIVRRQALKDGEAFWSPPTKRVSQAMLPALGAGLLLGLLPEWSDDAGVMLLPPIWMICYGSALHAAGFFMQRGIRLFGWGFLVAGGTLLAVLRAGVDLPGHPVNCAHALMGVTFGGFHIAYGAYLYVTEPPKHAL